MQWFKPRGGSFHAAHLVGLYQMVRQQSMQTKTTTTTSADGRCESLAAMGKLPGVEMYAGCRKCSCWLRSSRICGGASTAYAACMLPATLSLDSPATEARQYRPRPLLSSPSLARSSHP